MLSTVVAILIGISFGFIYAVSQSSITGNTASISKEQKAYFNRINDMRLSTPHLIGFGIHDKKSFESACNYANGAIIGSAFIRHLATLGYGDDSIKNFISTKSV